MIRAKLLSSDGTQETGGAQLIEQWRATDSGFLWLDIEGELTPQISNLLQSLGCNQLAIKDCMRQRHPPKLEVFNENTFILFRGIASIDDNLSLAPQQVGLWVSDRYLISVHSGLAVSVNHFWEQASDDNSLSSPAALALQLLHFATGRYLDQILSFEDTLEELEDDLLGDRADEVMIELVTYRSRLQKLLRIFSYHQGMSEQLLHQGTPHLGSGRDQTYHLRRNLFDRCERLHTLCGMYYDICGDLVEGYISLSSYSLNNTMKVLTIITAIFVPLSFLAGLYGMNFRYMPELEWGWGYFGILAVMATVAVSMLIQFRRIKWL